MIKAQKQTTTRQATGQKENDMNNYRVDVFRDCGAHYKIEFPEHYISKMFAERIAEDFDVQSVYMLERISDNSFDVVKKIK